MPLFGSNGAVWKNGCFINFMERGTDMEKMRKGFAMFCILILSLTVMAGCGSGEEESKFVGTWEMTAGKVNGVSLPADQIKEQLGTISIVVKEDGIAEKKGIGLDATGRWKETENGITVSDKDGTNAVAFTWKDDTLSGDIKGIEILLKKNKNEDKKEA